MKKDNENWQILVQLLKEIADDKGISQIVIAEKTGYTQPNISRIFSLRYTPRLDVFLNIARAIGVNFFFEDQESKVDFNVIFERAMTELGRRENFKDKRF